VIHSIQVVLTVEELEDLPLGRRIATNTNQIFERDEAYGKEFWIEPGTLEPVHTPRAAWLPAYVLPSVVDETEVSPALMIRAGRERKMMTQRQLAQRVGVSLRTIGNWERGETVPVARWAMLADVLGIKDPRLGKGRR
jgi:DNA-binding XRE family transcriptional regulator